MNPTHRLAVLAVFLSSVLVAVPAVAQDAAETPEPGAASLELVPEPTLFGEEWSMQRDPVLFVPSDSFRDGAIVSYGGPDGSRIVLAAMLVTDNRVAVRASWEEIGQLFDQYKYDLNYDYQLEDELGNAAPPNGCVEAKRIEGVNKMDSFFTGVTLCAGELDEILLVVASGEIGQLSGYRASDSVVSSVLSNDAFLGDGTPES